MKKNLQKYFADVSHALFKRPNGLNPISSLDGLRSLLILSVLAAHALMWATSFIPNTGRPFELVKENPLYCVFSYHFLQFDGFFVLSGFILCSQLLLRWRLLDGMSLKDMVVGRALGVVPSMVVVYAVFFALKEIHSRNFLVSILFMHNFLKSNYYPFSAAPNWLFSTDMQLWIAMFILFNILHRLKLLSGKTLMVLLVAAWVLPFLLVTPEHMEGLSILLKTPHIGTVVTKDYAAWMELRFRHVWYLTSTIQDSTESFLSKYWFQGYTRLSAFLVGCLAGYYFNLYHVAAVESKKEQPTKSVRQSENGHWLSSFAFILCLLILVAPLLPWRFASSLVPWIPLQLSTSTPAAETAFMGFMGWRYTWSIAFGTVLFSTVTPSTHAFHSKRLKSFLSHPRWIPISRLSHAAFVVHFRLQLSLAEAIRPSYPPGFLWICALYVLSVVLSYAAAWILFVLVEVPVMKLRSAVAGPVAKNKPE